MDSYPERQFLFQPLRGPPGPLRGHRGLHLNRHLHGALRLQWARHLVRRAEEAENAVSHEAGKRSAVPLDYGCHFAQMGIDNLGQPLGLDDLGQRREAGHVGEEDRNEPALASQLGVL